MKIHYNVEMIIQILKNVYEFIRVPISLYDEKFGYIASYSRLGHYCTLVRAVPDNLKQCYKSDRDGCEKCKECKSGFSYKCHAGLWETVVPIKSNDHILGYIMFGTYRLAGEEIDLRSFAEKLCVDEGALGKCYNEVSILTPMQVVAVGEILRACIIQFIQTDAIFLIENQRAEIIKRYIDENISSHITIDDLCMKFRISRRRLSDVFKESFNVSVKQYILEKQIDYSKHLLITTTKNITEIAEMSGFYDYNNFIQRFKNMEGVTPLKYRKIKVSKK